jgi:hypothetical protein
VSLHHCLTRKFIPGNKQARTSIVALRFFRSFALSNPKANSPGQSSTRTGAFPTPLKYNPMANWKVIALISGNIEAVSGPAA